MNYIKKISISSAVALMFATASPALAREAYGDWDTDGTVGISQDEFNAGFGEGGVYDAWDGDGDGALTEDEFNAGVCGNYDADESGVIEEPEFGDVGDDMGDGGLSDV